VLVAPVPAGGAGYSPKGEAYLRATAGDPVAVKAWLARTFSVPPDDATLSRLCDAAALTPREIALESFESWAHADFAEATRSIRVPALILAPEKDAPQVSQERVEAFLPNGRTEILPQCGHYAILESPDAVAESLRTFLR
jgi:pimeloyl-ACP methyl ester carboxylesterase